MRVAIVIPAYNEAATLRDVAARALSYGDLVIVVDDGSTDATAASVDGLPVTLLRHVRNAGKAASLWDGFEAALAAHADLVVTLDGDGQHRPEDVPRLVAASQQYPHRIVIGARIGGRERAPRGRRIANGIADFFVSWAAGQRIADTQSGERAYPAALLRAVMASDAVRHDRAASFTLESEILIVGARKGYETVAVPIASIYLSNRASHFRPIGDIARISGMLLRRLGEVWFDPRRLWRSVRGARGTIGAKAADPARTP
jgi:glycosyltransferase involved in cell wall biosynthesis